MSDYRGLIEEMEQDKSAEKDKEDGFHHSESHERLVCFMYLLMRDELPTGTVCKMLTDIGEADGKEFTFTNPHLEALARDYANRIREG